MRLTSPTYLGATALRQNLTHLALVHLLSSVLQATAMVVKDNLLHHLLTIRGSLVGHLAAVCHPVAAGHPAVGHPVAAVHPEVVGRLAAADHQAMAVPPWDSKE